MNTRLITFLSVSLLVFRCEASPEGFTSEAVVVKVVDVQLPHSEEDRRLFLWRRSFADKQGVPGSGNYGPENWKEHFAEFSEALIRKADEKKLNSASLRKALGLILKDSNDNKAAYLPIEAFQTTLDGDLVWIVTIKWERDDEVGAKLGHIRTFAFDQKNLKQVGFVTCT